MTPEPADRPQGSSQATITLTQKDLGIASQADAKVGSRVRIVLTGTVREVSKGNSDVSQEGSDTGSLQIDISSVRMAANSDIADLFEEEMGG